MQAPVALPAHEKEINRTEQLPPTDILIETSGGMRDVAAENLLEAIKHNWPFLAPSQKEQLRRLIQ